MLRQASVEDLRKGRVKRGDAHIVVAMHHHPRGLKKDLRDEFVSDLAPSDTLFADFYKHKDALGEEHNDAFTHCKYENRFGLAATGLAHLQRLVELSRQRDVYLVCQCSEGERCHRELLLLLAREWYGAQIGLVRFDYPTFEKRLARKPPANATVDVGSAARGRGLEWPVPLRE